MILSLVLPVIAFTTAGCPAVDADDTGLDSAATTITTSGPSDTSSGGMTTMVAESSSTEPSDTSGDPTCAGQIIDAPEVPNAWLGPVLAYGFDGTIGEAPDCGGGTPATSLGLLDDSTTTCACQCAAGPEDLCALSMFGDCEGGGLGGYTGGCQALDEPVSQFQVTATPLGSCASTGVATTPPLTAQVWGCEVPEDGCSEAPESDRVCIYAEGLASECPTGYENGPFMAGRIACEGDCDNCLTPDYCAMTLRVELHSTPDCSTPPSEIIAPMQCPGGLFEAVRAVPEPLTCVPATELVRTPEVVSVCCQP